MEDEIVVDEADLIIEDDHESNSMSRQSNRTTHLSTNKKESSSTLGELLKRLRSFQKKVRDNEKCMAPPSHNRSEKVAGSPGLTRHQIGASLSVSGHFNAGQRSEEIVSHLEFRLKQTMESQPDREVDVIELVRKDTNAKYSKEDVKRITRRLVKRITEDAVVGKIVDDTIENLDDKSVNSSDGASQKSRKQEEDVAIKRTILPVKKKVREESG